MKIRLNNHVFLKTITINDAECLYQLMKEIYPPAYAHYWEDEGAWYIKHQFSKENLEKELLEDQLYYFVLYKDEIKGIVCLLFDETLNIKPNQKTVKLHRIYLHQDTQGKGIGKLIMSYLEHYSKELGYKVLWLEVMQEQPQAYNFYKKLGFELVDSYSYDKELLYKKYRPMLALWKNLN